MAAIISKLGVGAGLIVFVVSVVACSDPPVSDLGNSFTFQVRDRQENFAPAKVDFLWVIDNSTSMCQEQISLYKSFKRFVAGLRGGLELDARMAVVTTNVLGEHGVFRTAPPEQGLPPNCRGSMPKACLKHADCMMNTAEGPALPDPGGDGSWVCSLDGKSSHALYATCGGLALSTCRLVCSTEQVCVDVFGAGNYCKEYTADNTDPGCLPTLPACTPPLPPYHEFNATSDGTDTFLCAAVVGVHAGFDANLEQGLNAARFALDRFGPNPQQARDFLRDDAWLVIIILSDEDDSSPTESCLLQKDHLTWQGEKYLSDNCITKDQYGVAPCLGTTDGDGPLEPINRFVNVYKSMKGDPSRVLAAVVVGDSQAANGEARDKAREEHHGCRCTAAAGQKAHPICTSRQGTADLGHRYLELAKAFGDNGLAANICGPTPCALEGGDQGIIGEDGACRALSRDEDVSTIGVQRALDLIADTVVRRVARICLPHPVRCPVGPSGQPSDCGARAMEVLRTTASGETVALTPAPEGARVADPGQYLVIDDPECEDTGQAITFGDLLDKDEAVEIRYEGDTSK